MNTSCYSLFKPTSLTMVSGLLTIVATTIALGSIAHDQSGQAAAIVSKSFRTKLGAQNDNTALVLVDFGIKLPEPPENRELPDLTSRPLAQVKRNVDPRQDFANLQLELERIVGEFKTVQPMQEIQLHVFDADPEIATSISAQIIDFLATAESRLSHGIMKIEIQTWAASPTPTAWIEATQAANNLRDQVTAQIPQSQRQQFQISSSAALWSHQDRLRPAATIVLFFTR